jgi:hypothetical protein
MDLLNLATKVAGAAADTTLSAHGIPGGGAATEALLHSLLGLVDEQAETITRIDKAVTRLIDGPWETARLHLQEAQLPGRDKTARRAAIAAAADKMRDAIPLQEAETLRRAYAALDLALLLTLLGDTPAARMYAHKSAEAAVGYLRALAEHRVHPPGLRAARTKTIAAGLTGGSVVTVVGALHGLGAVAATAVHATKQSLTSLDAEYTTWAQTVSTEVDKQLAALTVLCGRDDWDLSQITARLPHGLSVRKGTIVSDGNERVGLAALADRWKRSLTGSGPGSPCPPYM